MITDKEMVEEKIIADLEDVDEEEFFKEVEPPEVETSSITGWGDKAHDILDRIGNELEKLRLLIPEEHDCKGIKCSHLSHNQI